MNTHAIRMYQEDFAGDRQRAMEETLAMQLCLDYTCCSPAALADKMVWGIANCFPADAAASDQDAIDGLTDAVQEYLWVLERKLAGQNPDEETCGKAGEELLNIILQVVRPGLMTDEVSRVLPLEPASIACRGLVSGSCPAQGAADSSCG